MENRASERDFLKKIVMAIRESCHYEDDFSKAKSVATLKFLFEKFGIESFLEDHAITSDEYSKYFKNIVKEHRGSEFHKKMKELVKIEEGSNYDSK